jgi:hypothetical protein
MIQNVTDIPKPRGLPEKTGRPIAKNQLPLSLVMALKPILNTRNLTKNENKAIKSGIIARVFLDLHNMWKPYQLCQTSKTISSVRNRKKRLSECSSSPE